MSSNSTTTSAEPTFSSTSTPVSITPSTSPSQTPTTSSSIPPDTTTSPTPTTTTSNTQQTSSSQSTSSSPPQQTSSTPTTALLTTVTETGTNSAGQATTTVLRTSTQNNVPTNTGSSTSSSTSGSATAGLQGSGSSTSSGLSSGGTIAIAVVVPIVAVALLILAGLYFWRKRKARKDAEELRRKEVEEYGYNPNNDPTLPAVAGATGSPDGYEMQEDGGSGYRGWGTTAVASSGRKASTTLSGGQSPGGIGMAYSEGTSPTHGPVSDTRSDHPLVDASGRPISGEAESLGAMGPAASGNRSDINRGPSNASSSYSAANRSDGSGEVPGSYGTGQYYNGNAQYEAGNPYTADNQYGSPPGRAEMGGQPVIRDVQARRNTRIENPAHFPQQSAGISQNF